RATSSRESRSAASLERQRLHDLDAVAAAERKRAGVRRRGQRIAPEEQALGAWPDAMEDAPLTILAEQIAVPVAKEAARAGAQLHQPGGIAVGARPLLLADLGLVIRHAEMFGPELRRDLHGLLRSQRRVNHPLVHALGVHVDLDPAPARRDTVEDGLPE